MSLAWLSDTDVLIVSKPLAKVVGVNGSIVMRRVQHWLKFNEKYPKKNKIEHFHDGRWWAMHGYQGWADDLEVFTYSTTRRTFTKLEEMGLLIATNKYNRKPKDETKWWSIDYDLYDDFIALWQHMGSPLCADGGKQPKKYSAFLEQWKLYLVLCTLLTVGRVARDVNPAHGESGPVHGEQGKNENPAHGATDPAHGEQPYPRESTEESESDESSDQAADDDDDEKESLKTKIFSWWKIVKQDGQGQADVDEAAIEAAISKHGGLTVFKAVVWADQQGKKPIRGWAYIETVLDEWHEKGQPDVVLPENVKPARKSYQTGVGPGTAQMIRVPAQPVYGPMTREEAAWQTTLHQLEVQLDRQNFDTWLWGTTYVRALHTAEKTTFVLGARNAFAADRLQLVLNKTIERVLRDVYGKPVGIVAEVGSDKHVPTG